jgi:hypothetical protein
MPKYYNLPVTTTLIQDLHAALYRQRLQDQEPNSAVFKCLKDRAEEFLDYILLSFDHENYFETGRPISHTVLDIMACVEYLREKAGMEKDRSCMTSEFPERRVHFWKGKLGTQHSMFRECLLRCSSKSAVGYNKLERMFEDLSSSSKFHS